MQQISEKTPRGILSTGTFFSHIKERVPEHPYDLPLSTAAYMRRSAALIRAIAAI